MVAGRFRSALLLSTCAVVAICSGAEQQRPLLEQLDPAMRGLVLLVLMILVLVGLTLMVVAWIGGRHAKRVARSRPPERAREVSDWDRRHPGRHGEVDDDELEDDDPDEIDPDDPHRGSR